MASDAPKTRAPRARKKTPEEWADFIVGRAGALRAAGVLQVELDGVTFVLAPPQPAEPEYPDIEAGPRREEPADPFDDPHTYGLGGRIPAFPRDKRIDDE